MFRITRAPLAWKPVFLTAVTACFLAAGAAAADKIVIEKQDDLPRHTYEITGSVEEMVDSWELLAPLARQIRANLEADLETYDIRDKNTLQGIQGTLLSLDALEKDYDSALKRLQIVRELEDKEGLKLTTGLGLEARVIASREVGDESSEAFHAAFRRVYAEKLDALPWDVVQDVLQGNKGQLEMLSANLLRGILKEQIIPVIEEAGSASGPMAQQIVGFHSAIYRTLPVKDDIVAVLQDVIDRNQEEKEDIWAARDLDLTDTDGLSPVVVAVWDTGVDPSVFGSTMLTRPGETVDGKDTDGNGFVDDVHGIAYDLHWKKTSGMLAVMDDATRPIPELQNEIKGLFDMRAAVDSPEAQKLRQRLSTLGEDEVKSFMEDLGHYSLYSHGTHVAGIAVAGNPAAKILVARLTGDPSMIPEAPTMEDSYNSAKGFQEAVDYYKEHGVRVVNMSWIVTRSSFEGALEMNNVGKDAEERKQMAREMFDVSRDGMLKAMKSAPEILFVGGAGNSDNDVEFDEFFPPMFQLDNLLIAGAVDQAGEATTFTSFGSTVNVYSNGFEVESYVPGGDRIKFSGTSMASPNVANLAAKLLAMNPKLTPPEVVSLILDGADEVQEGEHTMRIIHPQRSAELLKGKGKRASM